MPVGKRLGLALAPLNHGDGLVGRIIEVKVIQFSEGPEPVRIHVHQPRPIGRGFVGPRDDECGARHLAAHSKSGADALDRAAVAGISASVPFPPLPAEFKGDRIILQKHRDSCAICGGAGETVMVADRAICLDCVALVKRI